MILKCFSKYGGELFLCVSDLEVFPMSNGRFDVNVTTYSGRRYCATPTFENRLALEYFLRDYDDEKFIDHQFREVND